EQDIGTPAPAGSASYASGQFTVKGSGADIWGGADEFHFVYQPLSGNGTLIARVASQQNTSSWAKSGIMIRQSLAADSAHAFIALTPGNGAVFQERTQNSGGSSNTSGPFVAAPYW